MRISPREIETTVLNNRYESYLKRFWGRIKVTHDNYYRLYDKNWRWIEFNFVEHLWTAVEFMAAKKIKSVARYFNIIKKAVDEQNRNLSV